MDVEGKDIIKLENFAKTDKIILDTSDSKVPLKIYCNGELIIQCTNKRSTSNSYTVMINNDNTYHHFIPDGFTDDKYTKHVIKG